jgi:glycosidase
MTAATTSDYGDGHDYLRENCAELVKRRKGDAILLGEVNLQIQAAASSSAAVDGDELTCSSISRPCSASTSHSRRCDARPLAKMLADARPSPASSQWANFVRNHDELTLDKLSDTERNEVFSAFGPEERMQVYGRGIVRRLPPMLDGDPRRIRMVYSLLFSLPGTPVLFYGEELGMGENLDAGGSPIRANTHAVDRRQERRVLNRPAIAAAQPGDGGQLLPAHINANAQRSDPDSLLQFVRHC